MCMAMADKGWDVSYAGGSERGVALLADEPAADGDLSRRTPCTLPPSLSAPDGLGRLCCYGAYDAKKLVFTMRGTCYDEQGKWTP